jgi:hypothetical protein
MGQETRIKIVTKAGQSERPGPAPEHPQACILEEVDFENPQHPPRRIYVALDRRTGRMIVDPVNLLLWSTSKRRLIAECTDLGIGPSDRLIRAYIPTFC